MNNVKENNIMQKHYIIEDNLDFKTELTDKTISDNNSRCLISQQVLTRSHITLPCSHKFNYIPLYNEVCQQKMKNVYKVMVLKINQLKCPYCRNVFDILLPYLPSEIDEKKTGVNFPPKYCMALGIECDWVNKSGKNKGVKCTKDAQYIDATCYCKLHYKRTQIVNQQ